MPGVRKSAAGLLAAICLGVSLAACLQGPGAAPPESATADGDGSAQTAQSETPAPPSLTGTVEGAGRTLSVADVSAAETDGALRFTVSLNAAAADPVTVSYATENDTATAGHDYRGVSGTLTFPAESSQAQQVEVAIVDDRVAEGNETFLLLLGDASGASLAAESAIATIVDDDGRSVRAYPAALNVTEGGTATYTIALGSQPTGTVSVSVIPGSAELTVQPELLSFTSTGWQAAQTVTVSAGDDQDAEADAPVAVAHGASGGGYGGTGTEVTVTIVEDDVATLAVAAARASEQDGGIDFEVTLSLTADQEVSVGWATGAGGDTANEGEDYASGTGTLRFPAGSTAARTIAVVVHDDEVDEVDEQFTMTLSNPVNAELAGGGATMSATGTIEDDDAAPQLSIEDATIAEGSRDGVMRFAVRLQPVSARVVTVNYATADATAIAGADYTAASGTLTFSAGSATHTVAITITDDALDEDDSETFTVTLSAAVNATVESAGGTATGAIEDDDSPPQLSIEGATIVEGSSDAAMRFAVRLQPVSARMVTVNYATADATAIAGADYTAASGTLTLNAGSTTGSIAVPILNDETGEDTETFTVTLSNPSAAILGTATATGEITDDGDLQPLELASLEVTGGLSAMYPAFAADVYHYAIKCGSDLLEMNATAKRSTALLTVPHFYDHRTVSAVSSLNVTLDLYHNDDIVIRLSDTDGTATYTVHCVPANFPDISVLTKTDGVSDGLLFVWPRYTVDGSNVGYMVILDNNGVPRFHRSNRGKMFQRHSHGPVLDGKRVWYSYIRGDLIYLLDAEFDTIQTIAPLDPLTNVDSHDFQIIYDEETRQSSFLLVSRFENTRDYSDYEDKDGNSYSSMEEVRDSVLQEISTTGEQLFLWNSWDHVKLDPDCRKGNFTGDYAHLNAFYVANDGNIVASLSGCRQVVKIDRSSGTGALLWKLGGSDPTRSDTTEFLEIVGDELEEVCGQHSTVVTASGELLMFDNRTSCQGSRKNDSKYSRIVEYDISSGTQAVLSREYRHPRRVYTGMAGSVRELANGNWLIGWGNQISRDNRDEAVSITEVDPDTGTVYLEMLFATDGKPIHTYRANRYDESGITIPVDKIAGSITVLP